MKHKRKRKEGDFFQLVFMKKKEKTGNFRIANQTTEKTILLSITTTVTALWVCDIVTFKITDKNYKLFAQLVQFWFFLCIFLILTTFGGYCMKFTVLKDWWNWKTEKRRNKKYIIKELPHYEFRKKRGRSFHVCFGCAVAVDETFYDISLFIIFSLSSN